MVLNINSVQPSPQNPFNFDKIDSEAKKNQKFFGPNFKARALTTDVFELNAREFKLPEIPAELKEPFIQVRAKIVEKLLAFEEKHGWHAKANTFIDGAKEKYQTFIEKAASYIQTFRKNEKAS